MRRLARCALLICLGSPGGAARAQLPGPDSASGLAPVASATRFAQAAPSAPTPLLGTPWTFRAAFQRPDLLRYNRVEGLSVGARAQIRPSTPWGPLSLTGIVRLGTAALDPEGTLTLQRETIERRVTLRVALDELTPLDERARDLGLGNSLLAGIFGRDDGDYYRRWGAMLEWTPPTADPRSFRVRGWAERHGGVGNETDFAVIRAWTDGWSFRPNLVADPGWEYGGSVELSPAWGADPSLWQGGLDVGLQAATGEVDYARASVFGRLSLPLPARFSVGIAAGGGTSWGAPPAQRLWYVGGPSTLRGFDPRTAGGTSFARWRGELARGFSFGRLSLFSDVAWAGARSDARWGDVLRSAGGGMALLDGLIRVDAAWGLRGTGRFRVDAYLDQIL